MRIARSWVYEAPAPLASIAASIIIERALQQAFTRYLLAQGRIGEAAFARLVGLPKWFRLGKFGGSFAGALIVTLVIQLGIDAVDGAVQRSKLRDAIKDLATPRFRMRRAILINRELISSLSGLASAYKVQQNFLAQKKTMTEAEKLAMLHEFTEGYVEETRERIAAITDTQVLDDLKTLDTDRKSWKGDDKDPDTSPEQPTVEQAMETAFLEDADQILALA